MIRCKLWACNAVNSTCHFSEDSQLQYVKTTEAVQTPVFINNIHNIIFTSLRQAYRLSQPQNLCLLARQDITILEHIQAYEPTGSITNKKR